MVTGEWSGHYELDSSRIAFTVFVNLNSDQNIIEVSNPPLSGLAEYEEYRFCPAGAFHFKKNLSFGYFEFDGVPISNSIRETLVVSVGDVQKTGNFFIERVK